MQAPVHCAQNIQFANLTYHKDDFSSNAEWHFSATSHGKNLVKDWVEL
jgi:hypothetical protein